MSDLFIRRATIDEAPAIASVFLDARHSMREIVPMVHPDSSVEPWIRTLFARASVWVADIDGRMAGMMVLSPSWIEHLYVDPARHNEGTGAALLLRAKNAPEAIDGLQLWTFQANAGARRFYERYGFVAQEFRDGAGNEERKPDMRYAWTPSRLTADS